jgi:MFS family permease
MIACDLGRLLALVSVPVAFAFNALTMEQLYVVALITGIGTVFFDVAYQSYLPALIPRGDLVEGNTKLQVTGSAAQMAGPALAGFLIRCLGQLARWPPCASLSCRWSRSGGFDA